jgi:SAM-dependent methyltransferase
MASRYSPDRIRAFFDKFGEGEWTRFERGVAGRVNLELHRRFLNRWIHPGDRVLEVGAGPGRFTIELARLGARVVVSDISGRQLELNREKVMDAGCEGAVEARALLDVTDLGRFPEGSFDSAIAYGGPSSYVFERAGQGLDQLLAVVRDGGVVLFSVMSRWGSMHQFLDGILEQVREGLEEEYRLLVETGDLVATVDMVEPTVSTSGSDPQIRPIEEPARARVDQLPGAKPMAHLAVDDFDDVDVDDRDPATIAEHPLGLQVDLLGAGEPLVDELGWGILRLHSRRPERGGGLEVVGGDRLVEASHGSGRIAAGGKQGLAGIDLFVHR